MCNVPGSSTACLPAPSLCPECRLQRRFAFRNDWHYYRRTCDCCSNAIVSIYQPSASFPVYCPDCFGRDDWDPLTYGREFDFSRPFFEQYCELQRLVPRVSIFQTQSEGSAFSVHSSRNKNCYLVSSVHESENVLFGDLCRGCRDCLDLYSCDAMELCFQCLFSLNCYGSEYLEHCVDVHSSAWCLDCRGSSMLIGCVGLRQSTNAILNRAATPEQCAAVRAQLHGDRAFAEQFFAEFERLCNRHPHPAQWLTNCEDSNGSFLRNCVRADACCNSRFLEDCCLLTETSMDRDCACCARCTKCELLYECHGMVETTDSLFCNLTYNSTGMLYCDNCRAGCANCFGCISLNREHHCVLNRRVPAAEYGGLVARIAAHMRDTGEWGQFFPPQVSPFAYNDTTAHVWFPLDDAAVRQRGWRWSDYRPEPSAPRVVRPRDIPESIEEIGDDILELAIECEASGRPFRLTKYELDFYRRRGIALPLRSPWQRQSDRVAKLPKQPRQTACSICATPVEAYHPANAPYPICCGDCYTAQR